MKNSVPVILRASALGLLCSTLSATGASVGGYLRNLQVEGYHFSTSVRGGGRTLSTKDTASVRFLILRLSADVPASMNRIFGPDRSQNDL